MPKADQRNLRIYPYADKAQQISKTILDWTRKQVCFTTLRQFTSESISLAFILYIKVIPREFRWEPTSLLHDSNNDRQKQKLKLRLWQEVLDRASSWREDE